MSGENPGPLQQLRRRKVVQWGIAYAAGAWGLLQGIAYMRDTFGWPQQLQQVATIVLLIGLPIALVLAWYHGERGDHGNCARHRGYPCRGGRKVDRGVAVRQPQRP
jgi:hypothetical protein